MYSQPQMNCDDILRSITAMRFVGLLKPTDARLRATPEMMMLHSRRRLDGARNIVGCFFDLMYFAGNRIRYTLTRRNGNACAFRDRSAMTLGDHRLAADLADVLLAVGVLDRGLVLVTLAPGVS